MNTANIDVKKGFVTQNKLDELEKAHQELKDQFGLEKQQLEAKIAELTASKADQEKGVADSKDQEINDLKNQFLEKVNELTGLGNAME